MSRGLRNLPDEQTGSSIEHTVVPSAVSGRMDQAMNAALSRENIIMSPEIRRALNSVLDMYKGQVYRELDVAVRTEVTTAQTRSELQGLQDEVSGATPRQLTTSITGQERLINQTILERFEPIATNTARIISRIAESEGEMLSRNDGENGYSLTEYSLFKVSTVLLKMTDYVAEPDSFVMSMLSKLCTNPELTERDGYAILAILDAHPNAYADALAGTMDELVNHGNAQTFDQAGILLTVMTNRQKEDLISIAIDSLDNQNMVGRLQSIKQIALYTGFPVARAQSIINSKIQSLGPAHPLVPTLTALSLELGQEAPIAQQQYQEAMQRMTQMNPEVFRIISPTSPSRLVGFGMAYWGAATMLSNVFLALCQGKPETFLKNIGHTVVGGTVALMGGKLLSGQDPLSIMESFTKGLTLDKDNKNALEQRNWAQLVNDNLLSAVGGETLALWADDRFIRVLNSMGDNFSDDKLIRFSTAQFVQKLRDAGLDGIYQDSYGDTFSDNPRLEETRLNLLANAYRGLRVRDRNTFMSYAARPFGLTEEDIPTLTE